MKKNYSYKFDVFQNDKNIDITLFQYGWEQCAPMHSYGPAKRNHYLFHYIFSGKGYLSSNDSSGNTKLYRLEGGQGFLICPGQVNTYYADEHNPWEYAWVEFDGVKALEFMEMAGLGYDHPVYRIKKREYFDFIRDEIMYIVDNPLHSPINQIGHLYLFFDGLIRGSAVQNPAQPQKMKNSYIKEAISFRLYFSCPVLSAVWQLALPGHLYTILNSDWSINSWKLSDWEVFSMYGWQIRIQLCFVSL